MELHLKGRKALITGASRGIGYGIAELLAQEGCDVTLAARSAQALATAQESLASRFAVKVETHATDLSQADNCVALAKACPDIDILVNNAGAIPGGSLIDLPDAPWREAWDLKVFGFINLSREVYRQMQARGRGVIVNVIGMAGERPMANYIAGSMANASLIALTRALGADGMNHGVRVVGVNPGNTETDRQTVRWRSRALEQLGDENRWRELTQGFPLGRLATVDEIASAVVFLCSDRSAYTNAIVLTVDGGWTAIH